MTARLMASSRNLLVCFDAHGTLYTPKRPIFDQYGEVARALGMSGFRNEDIGGAFKTAFKREAKEHPNFGKSVGMDPEKWWANVITNTFQPLIGVDTRLPHELVPSLLHRFTSKEGYSLMPGARSVLDRLNSLRRDEKDGRTVVGLITNSDNRVPDILTSLGVSVGSFRHGGPPAPGHSGIDIDFVVMSFDVGHEKPDRRIFDAALELAQAEDGKSNVSTWQKIYVGDEFDNDIRGSNEAGWRSVLVGARDERVFWLDDEPAGSLSDMLQSHSAVGFKDLGSLAKWLR